MKKGLLLIGMIACGLIAAWAAAKQAPTPPPIIIKNEQGEQAQLYANSYALLIGVSDYTNGWRSLPGVKDDIAAVKAAPRNTASKSPRLRTRRENRCGRNSTASSRNTPATSTTGSSFILPGMARR